MNEPSLRPPAIGWPEIAAAFGFVVGVALLRDVPLGHDAIWQLWIGRQLAHGARLYTDIVEVNPPLWFWMAVPLVHASQVAGTSPRVLLKVGFFAALALSLVLVAALGRGASPGARLAVYAATLLAGTAVVLHDFGQREQYVLLASIPYVLLIALRADRSKPIPVALAVATGVFAASGLALKIHFALVPLALEGWLWFKLRRGWSPVRPELLALAACALAYGVCVIAFSPDYLKVTVPMLLRSYARFGDPPLFYFAYHPVAVTAFLALVACHLRGGPRTPTGEAAFVAAAAFLACYVAQGKGWQYHAFPALGMLVMLACVESTSLRGHSLRERWGAPPLAGAFLLAMSYSLHAGPYRNADEASTQSALAGLRRGDTAMVLTVYPPVSWPMVEDLGLVWPSRYMSLWMLPALLPVMAGGHAPGTSASLEALARTVRAAVLQDLACHPPRRIVADEAPVSLARAGETRLSVLDFVRGSPEGRAFLERYRPGPKFGRLSTFDLVDAGSLRPGPGCRRVF